MRYWFFIFCLLGFISTAHAAKKPKIVGQRELSTSVNQPITISLADLFVEEDKKDATYPEGYTLEVFSGRHYTVSGHTVTPDQGFNGMLKVPVQVRKENDESKRYDLIVEVLAVKDEPPVITGQVALSTPENTPITVELEHLTVNDPDNAYPDGFSLSVYPGTNYSIDGNTVTPLAGFSGTLTVPVTVNDGTESSETFNLSITVEHVNVAPTITGQSALSTPENTAITLDLSNLTVTDPDNSYPTGFSLTVSPGANYTVSGTTVTPSAGFSGDLSVPVTVSDGTSSSAPFNVVITVQAHVNVAPTITGQSSLSTSENTPITLLLSNLTVTDPDNTYPTGFSLTVSPGENYTVSGATVTPAAGFSGLLSVPVTVSDGTSSSAPFNVVVAVQEHVNVAPTITGQSSLSTAENTPITLQLSDLTVTDPDNTYPTGFSLAVLAGTSYTVSGATVTPDAGFSGTLTVPVTVNDGTSDSAPFNLAIAVTPHVNVAPRITGQVPLSVLQNEPLIISLSNLVVTDPDNTYPDDFTLSVIGGTNYSVAGDIITPALNFTGTLSVRVTVSDGVADSPPFNVSVTVIENHVNQAPVITGQSGLSTLKKTPVRILLTQLAVTDPDNTYPKDFTLKILTGTNYTVSGNMVRPADVFTGTLTVNVVVNDGTSDSAPFPFRIDVIEPVELQIIGQVPLTIKEDSAITLQLSHLSVNDARHTYPQGFSLSVAPGENYTVDGTTVRPAVDLNGNLTVSVTVSSGTEASKPFSLLIVVTPVNDPPVVDALETDPLLYAGENAVRAISETLVVTDVDDEYLLLAEVGFTSGSYQPGADVLAFANTASIRGVFEEASGILTLIGRAPLAEYTTALRSINYTFSNAGDTLPSSDSKTIYILLNDGKTISALYERQISFAEDAGFDIPNAFTPNDDLANDTWKITPLKDGNWSEAAVVRIYNRRGILVYQTRGFDREWDGRLNGEVLPPDTYFYTIEVDLPYSKTKYSGVVAILR